MELPSKKEKKLKTSWRRLFYLVRCSKLETLRMETACTGEICNTN